MKPLLRQSGGSATGSSPATGGGQTPSSGSTPRQPKSDEPDWLSALRTDGPDLTENASDQEKPAEENAETPDWLSRIRDRARTETSSQPSDLFGARQEEETSDWMKGLKEEDLSKDEGAADQGLDDLLSRLSGSSSAASPTPSAPAGIPATPEQTEPPASGLDTADWLRSFGDEADKGGSEAPAFDFGAPPAGSAPQGEVSNDDWLSSLSAWQSGLSEDSTAPSASEPFAAKSEPGSGAQQPAPGAQDEFGWFSPPSEQPAPQAPSGNQAGRSSSGTGLTSFLARFNQQQEEQPPAEAAPGAAQSEEGGLEWNIPEEPPTQERPSSGTGLTGFLSSLDEKNAPQEQAPQAPTGEWNEAPFMDWSQEPAPQSGSPASAGPTASADTAASQEIGLPDWLSGESSTPESAAPAPQEGGLPDWFGSAPAPTGETSEPAPAAGETGLPGWLSALDNQPAAPSAPADQPSPAAPFVESGVPDWLKGGEEESSAASPAAPAAPFAETPGGLPSWLSGMDEPSGPAGVQPSAAPAEQPADQPAPLAGDLPAWLFEAGESAKPSEAPFTAAPEGETPPAPAAAPETGLPDWLSGDFAAPPATPAVEETPAVSPLNGGNELPDWFAKFDQSEIEKTQPSRVTGGLKPGAGAPLTPETPPAAPAGSFPGSQAQLAAPAGQPEQEAEPGQVPAWLREFDNRPPAEISSGAQALTGAEKALPSSSLEGDQPFTVDLPEWLGEDAAARPAEGHEQPAEAGGEQLAQAELPEWVKEMRPIETILPGEGQSAEVDQRVEKSGPLAGMRGVLPVEEIATRFRKPPIYSVKLHITEKQRSQVALLESILNQESQPLLIPPPRAQTRGVLLRVLISLILLLVIAFPVVFNFEWPLVPSTDQKMFPAENQMYQKLNQGLQPNATVLLAVEYEAGLSGEMRLAASALVEQLVEKNARIVLVSTVPAGPALGQQLVNEAVASYTARTGKDYKAADMIVNLGYLPGGTISLLDLAHNPRLAAPATLGSQPAWTKTFLKDLSGLSDFSQVVVLTDRAEVGRSWIEQVQPVLGNKVPLFMVASAQAAPLLQPYVSSGQIAGMTSGLLGGAIYARLAGLGASRALGYLSAYQVGVTLALVIMVVGGVISAILSMLKRGNKEEE